MEGSVIQQEQTRQLRELARVALHEFGFRQYRLRLVKHLVNTTFVLTCGAERYLVRVHRAKDHTPSRIESELVWLEALARDTTVAVQRPYRSPDGKLVIVASAPGLPVPYPITVLSWVKGRILTQDRRSPSHFERLGRLAATLHRHAQQWTPPPAFDRPTYDADGLIGPRSAFPLSEVGRQHVPDALRRDLETVYSQFRTVEQRLGRQRKDFGLIHSDLSFSNVLFIAGEARPIDFDECGYGFNLYDLAVMLAGPWGEPGFQERCEALVRGYREIGSLSAELMAHLPVFMAARATALILWALATSHDDFVQTQWKARVRPLLNSGADQFPA